MSVSFSNNINFGNGYYQDYNTQQHHAEHPALSIAGLAGASILLQKASGYLAHKLSQGDEFTSSQNVKKAAHQMLEDNGLKNKIEVGFLNDKNKYDYIKRYGKEMAGSFNTVAKGGNAFYMDAAKLAVAPASKPSLILHELGHAVNSSKGKFMRFLQRSRGWATAIPTLLLYLSAAQGDRYKDGSERKENWFKKNAGLIGFAAFTPTIVEEGMASYRGINAAKKALGKTAKLGILKRNYAIALGTYILSGIGLGVAAKQAVIGT